MKRLWWTIGIGWCGLLLLSWVVLYFTSPNAFQYMPMTMRGLTLTPLASLVAYGVVALISGPLTPGPNWFQVLTDDQKAYTIGTKIDVGLVMSSIFYCVFWAFIQV